MSFIKKINLTLFGLATLFSLNSSLGATDNGLSPEINSYIKSMTRKYNFDHTTLTDLFQKTNANLDIIDKMDHPYEKKSWPQYRKLFITQTKADKGALFIKQHQKVLEQAEKKYHVPAQVIVAIMGIETNYGERKGAYPVMQSLTTLAFYYKPRAKFFKHELTQYLLLTREQKLPPMKLTGSYAGAIGIPQFMPSAYRRYAIDYSMKGSADLVNDTNDAIFSIAHFLNEKGWKVNQPIAMPLTKQPAVSKSLLSKSAKPRYSLIRLKKYGIHLPQTASSYKKLKGAVIAMDMGNEKVNNYWLTFANFRAIMRYNPRINYAMAVYQLSEAIKDVYKSNRSGESAKVTKSRSSA